MVHWFLKCGNQMISSTSDGISLSFKFGRIKFSYDSDLFRQILIYVLPLVAYPPALPTIPRKIQTVPSWVPCFA